MAGASTARGDVLNVAALRLCDLTPADLDAWTDLSTETEEPNPFYEPGAVLPAARHLTGGRDVHLVLVREGQQLLLALPVRRAQRFRRMPVPALTGWRHPYCYLGTPLVRRGRAHDAWSALLAGWQKATAERWLALEQQRLDGPVARALADVLGATGRRAVVFESFERPVLVRRADFTYLDGRISSRHLKSLRRQRRRLADELGGPVVTVDRAQQPAALAAAVDGLLAVEQAGWKGEAGTAMASRPGDAAFFRELCRTLHAADRLQLWSLGTDERGAAYLANVLAGDVVFHMKIAYDESLRAHSPGVQLELEMVEEFHRDRRLVRLDSCGDAENVVSTQLYPDRDMIGTLLVPLRGWRGRAAARATPWAAAGYRWARTRVDALHPSHVGGGD